MKRFFKFYDCLVNFEVDSSNRAVCELNDFLTPYPRNHSFQRRFLFIGYSSTQTQYAILDS